MKYLNPASTLRILLATSLVGTPSAWAQDFDKEMERPQANLEEQRAVADTAQKADEQRSIEGAPGVTYDQVLADPDNIDLNYAYAKGQIEAGNLRQAAATLERILMVDPALPKVRLTYAVVLYRLDNLPEAQRELNALKDLPMPDSLQAEIKEYLNRIKRSRRNTNVYGRFGVGYQYDTNRNAAPADGKRLFAGSPVDLTSGFKTADTSVLVLIQSGITRDLGFQAGHNLFANLSHYRAEQTQIDTLDFQAYSWDVGGTIKSTQYGNFTPKAVFNYVSLKQQTYLRTRGFDFGWEKPFNDRVTPFLGLGVQFQEFINSQNVAVADERTGDQTSFRMGSHILLNARNRLTLGYGYTDKSARRLYNAYKRHSFAATHAWLLGKGMFLINSLSVNDDKYELAETAVHPTLTRHDTQTRIGFTFGAPLNLIARPLKDLLWTAHWDFFDSTSNITNFDYDNHKLNMMLTYKFDY